MSVHVFVGPSLRPQDRHRLDGVNLLPPIAFGDLIRLAPAPSDTVVIIDGLYHQSAPVRHGEIMHLLNAGVQVIGAASLGALRACELARFGMRGVGRVFEMYRRGEIADDGEVAVAHSADGAQQALTIALVTVRVALEIAAARAEITATDAAALLRLCQRTHYTQRSWQQLAATVAGGQLEQPVAVLRRIIERDGSMADVKRTDALTAIRVARADRPPAPAAGSPAADPPARPGQAEVGGAESRLVNGNTLRMLAELGPAPDQVGVTGGDLWVVLALFWADFPQLWTRAVCGAVLGRPLQRPAEDEALALAGQRVPWDDLDDATLGHWLTAAERYHLDPNEQSMRILIRSGRWHQASILTAWAPTADLPPSCGELARQALTAADNTNAEVFQATRRSHHRLKRQPVATMLRTLWAVAEPDGLDAAARDRGFADADAAIAHARRLYLGWRAGRFDVACLGRPVAVAQ